MTVEVTTKIFCKDCSNIRPRSSNFLDESEAFFMATNSKEKQREYDAKRAGRTRNFTTIVYPESAPENWLEILQQLFVPALVSPLHDKDVNPTGEQKKAHYHVVLMFDVVKTIEQVKKVVAEFGGVGCEKVNSLRGVARYLCHLDNPDKHQYNESEINQFCGVDYRGLTELASDIDESAEELLDYCEVNQITSFAKIRRIVRSSKPEWAQALRTRSIYISMTLKSMEWEITHGIDRSELQK